MPTLNTGSRIIQLAMQDAGLLSQTATPTTPQNAEYLDRLNDILNYLQTKGLKLWKQYDQSITLVAGQAKYTFMPGGDINITKPLRALQGYYLSSTNVRRQIWPMYREEYMRLSTTAKTGQISQYFVDKLKSEIDVYFWLTPDSSAATGTAHLLLQGQVTQLASVNDTVDFPLEWTLPIRWLLADEICGGQPQAIMDRCSQRAQFYREELENWDVEDTPTQFAPDVRMMQQDTGNFR